jgi:tetratricopeptide (TPR) repeat protein
MIVLNDLLEESPDCPSALNNRAQVWQLLKQLPPALEDLNRAISLCEVSSNNKVLGQSLCQRALIHRLNGQDEQSRQDFSKAAKLGNMFARRQLVQLNPYAALCNQMLGQMLDNVRHGKQEDA